MQNEIDTEPDAVNLFAHCFMQLRGLRDSLLRIYRNDFNKLAFCSKEELPELALRHVKDDTMIELLNKATEFLNEAIMKPKILNAYIYGEKVSHAKFMLLVLKETTTDDDIDNSLLNCCERFKTFTTSIYSSEELEYGMVLKKHGLLTEKVLTYQFQQSGLLSLIKEACLLKPLLKAVRRDLDQQQVILLIKHIYNLESFTSDTKEDDAKILLSRNDYTFCRFLWESFESLCNDFESQLRFAKKDRRNPLIHNILFMHKRLNMRVVSLSKLQKHLFKLGYKFNNKFLFADYEEGQQLLEEEARLLKDESKEIRIFHT